MAEAITRFGRYEIRGELGKGGFATVFRAWDAALGREVALKALQPHLALDANIRGRFMAEARAIAQLHHPNIITVHEVDEAGGRPFFTMELVNGPTLAALVAPGQGLPLGRVAEIMRSLASAVDYLHTRRLVHRDIKASNVMLDAWGRVVLMDFGVARAMDQTQLTQSGISIGTPEAMAPEQVRGQPAGPPADIYAIGVLSYRLLAGRAPFVGETIYVLHAHAYDSPPSLHEFRPGLPESVYAALDAALAKAPQDRPISAEQFAAALSVPSAETTLADTTARFVQLPARAPGETRTPIPSTLRPAEAPQPATQPVARPSIAASPAGAEPQQRKAPMPEASASQPEDLAATQAVRSVPTEPVKHEGKKGPPWPIIGGAAAVVVLVGVGGAVLYGSMGGAKNNNVANSPVVLGTATQQVAASASATRQVTVVPPSASAAVSASVGGTATLASTATAVPTTSATVVATASAAASATVAPPIASAVSSLLAGSGKAGFADGARDQAMFDSPKAVALDGAGNVYVSDSGNQRIRRISQNGDVKTIAGPFDQVSSATDYVDKPGTQARFSSPQGIVADSSGNVYVADANNNRIRKIDPGGSVTTYAGTGGTGLGGGGFADGRALTDAKFNLPTGLAIDADGNVYVADQRNNRIRKIDKSGNVTTVAGGEGGYQDGSATAARFNHPTALAVDATGNIYVADTDNQLIRKISPDGAVKAIAGTVAGGTGVQGTTDGAFGSAKFDFPSGIAVDGAGTIYVADQSQRIRKIAPDGTVAALAGSKSGYAEGAGAAAQFNFPSGIAVDGSGNLYVADSSNNRVRKVSLK